MKKYQRILLASSLAAVTFVAGCNRPAFQAAHEARPPAVDPAQIARADALISQPGWLRERLPEHTVAYLRVPSLWGTLSAPDGRPLDGALASDAHAKIVAALRKAAQSDPVLAQTAAGPAAQLLLGDQSGPIEVAVIDASDGVSPFSRALVTTTLDLQDVAALNARIAALAAGGPSPLQAPLDANGDASLQKFGAIHFDAASHRIYLSLGTTSSALTLQQDLAQTTSTHPHPMQEAEREIDASGQGLFAWLSMKGLNSQLETQLQNEPPDGLRRDLLDHAQSVALGWGTVDGRGRLQVQVRAPKARLLGYLAPDAGEVALKTMGKPDWAMTMALPGDDDLQAIHDNVDRDFGEGLKAHLDAAIGQSQQKLGIDPIAFARLFGPHIVFFEDANGRFAGVHVRDRKALYAKLDELGQRFGWKMSVAKIGDAQIHHLRIPSHDAANDRTDADPHTQAAMHLMGRVGTHFYWTEEGDYFVFAHVPQALVDRAASTPDVDLGRWLKDNQGYASPQTLVGIAATSRAMQREVYYLYLSMLQMAGDLLNQPVDLTTLPSAGQLKLPVEGATGIALQANDQRLALQVTYEQSPGEVLAGGGGMATVAVVGILAAIAIPAYQDYVIRSQVSEGAALAEGPKTAVAEYYANHGQLPHDNAQAGVPEAQRISGHYVSSVGIEDGKITVTYGQQANAALQGSVLLFAPSAQAGSVRWSCDSAAGTTVNVKYRPAPCRP